MKIVLEENDDPVPYRYCFICGEQYETTSVMAVAYTIQGIRIARICPTCVKAGPQGIKERAHEYAEKLRRITEKAENLAESLDHQTIEMPSLSELEDRHKVVSGRY